MKPTVISILNAKGGVGKTTVTQNLGAGLAQRGYKVLLIDTDLQANLTQSTIGQQDADSQSIANCLINEQGLDDVIKETTTKNLWVIPVNDLMVEVDLQLASKIGRERVLKNCLEATSRLSSFDFVLIDNPPYMSLITVNSLTASDLYLIPVSTAFLSMMGIKLLQTNISKLQNSLKLDLQFLGVVLTMYDIREKITKQVDQVLRKTLGAKVFDTVIRVNTQYKVAPLERQTIFQIEDQTATSNKGTEDFISLTDELLTRIQDNKRVANL